MARGSNKLTTIRVSKTKVPGRYADGGGLYLQVGPEGGKAWLFRYMLAGKARAMGLGGVADVTLAEAREAASEARKLVKTGVDPIEAKRTKADHARLEGARAMTFKQCADAYILAHKPSWRCEKHGDQWSNTLTTYAYPVFGELLVQSVDTTLVLKVLEPIWTIKTETASRVRGRIESVLDWATARKLRQGENPARLKGHLDKLLPARAKVQKVTHHPALPYAEIGAFMVALREREGMAARALEFLILTAARTSEALKATWGEFDLEAGEWIVPAGRMKAGKEHRVPLSAAAIAVLKSVKVDGRGFVFPGLKAGKPLSNMALLKVLERMGRDDLTAHGFRSTFRDWAAETTNFLPHVAEAALAHTVADKVVAAYQRGDIFVKRSKMMQAWANYCGVCPAASKVIAMRKAG